MKRLKRALLGSAMCAVAVIGAVSTASADTITYNTTGTFTDVGVTGSGTNQLSDSGNSLTFNSVSGIQVTPPSGSTSLGSISEVGMMSGLNGTFELDITQTAPPVVIGGPGSVSAMLSGSFTTSQSGIILDFGSNTSTSTVFSPDGITAYRTTFTLNNIETASTYFTSLGTSVPGTFNNNDEIMVFAPGSDGSTISATAVQTQLLVSELPVPASVWGGFGLLSLLGLGFARKRLTA